MLAMASSLPIGVWGSAGLVFKGGAEVGRGVALMCEGMGRYSAPAPAVV